MDGRTAVTFIDSWSPGLMAFRAEVDGVAPPRRRLAATIETRTSAAFRVSSVP
jgi:hypothetical protein